MRISTWAPVAVKSFAAATLTLAVAAGPVYTENIPAGPSATAGERAGWALLEAERADGLDCSPDPILTDRVIVRTAQTASVMTFDQALAATAAGSVTVVAYCSGGVE